MTHFIILLLLFSGLNALSASKYVDSTSTGANSGASWTDAWTNTSAIVWSGISAGDTIYISGGTTNRSYNSISVGKSGTSGAPITIRVGQDAGHNGLAILSSINLGGYQWIILNGARSDSYAAPTHVLTLEGGGSLTNNIGFRFTQLFPGPAAGAVITTQGVFVNGQSGANNTIRWTEIGPMWVDSDDGTNDAFGIRFLNLAVNTNFLVEYCYIHDIRNDGINLNDVTGTVRDAFDNTVVRWTCIGFTGDDGIQWSENGLTVENSFFDSHLLGIYHGHPDQIQFAGISRGYFKIINDVFRNKANSLIIGEHVTYNELYIGPFFVAGNIFYDARDWAYITNATQAYGVSFSAWQPNAGTSVERAYLTNFYYLNNTMYFQATEPFKVGRANPSGSTRSVWDMRIVSSAVRNNLHIHNKWNAPSANFNFNLGGSGEPGSGTNGVFYSTNDFPMTHNVNAGINRSGAYYTNSFTNFSSFGFGNTSDLPLVETNNYTFALESADTVARNAGYNISSFTNQFPALMTDLAGNSRFADGSPDIGALEFTPAKPELRDGVTNGLLLWLTFEDTPADADDGYADFSTNAAHGRHYGYLASHTASNRVPTQVLWTNLVTGLTNTAGGFERFSDGWGFYGESGRYLAVTNLNLRELNRATILFWNRYGPNSGSDSWTTTGNRRPLSGGFGYKGSWTIGLFGAPFTQMRLYTNDNANSDVYFNLAPGTEIKTSGTGQGDSTNLSFYSLTWSNGVLKTWKNNTAIGESSYMLGAGVTNLTVRGPSGSQVNGFLMVGGDSHNGNPALTPTDDSGEQYPNHGWHVGSLDDVRIFNRVLSDAEIAAIYYGTNYVAAGGGESSTPGHHARRANVRQLRIGR